MRAPEFWARDGTAARLLAPLGVVYDGLSWARRLVTQPTDCGVPVLCVGNLVLGGAGKTPVALSLAERLLARGHRAQFLTRGYGGREAGPLLVEPSRHSAADVGDEALLLAAVAPTWVSRDRVSGARTAIESGARLIVLDDGFQNPSLAKTLSVVVIDGVSGLGNGRIVPAGPLRESPARAIKRAHALVVLGDAVQSWHRSLAGDRPVLDGDLRPATESPPLAGRRLAAFAGIGRPEKFFAMLEAEGAELILTKRFPDHYRYRRAELDALLDQARRLDATAITTAKDHVRLPPDLAEAIEFVPVTLVWREPEAVDRLLTGLFDCL